MQSNTSMKQSVIFWAWRKENPFPLTSKNPLDSSSCKFLLNFSCSHQEAVKDFISDSVMAQGKVSWTQISLRIHAFNAYSGSTV